MSTPQAIFVQTSTKCNAKCTNCPHSFTYGKSAVRVMPDEVWEKLVKDLNEMKFNGQVGFYLHYEPFCDPKIFDRIVEIKTHTMAFPVLSTNGSMLSQSVIEKIITCKPALVHVNINSADPAQYEKQTGLRFNTVIPRVQKFIKQASTLFSIEINCPVQSETDVERLKELFPGVRVNTEFWANSRGGLLPDILESNMKSEHGSRFKIGQNCKQPSVNFPILVDGSVIICCQDWAHESKKDFPNILTSSIREIYESIMLKAQDEFDHSRYQYKMCQVCAREMGWIV